MDNKYRVDIKICKQLYGTKISWISRVRIRRLRDGNYRRYFNMIYTYRDRPRFNTTRNYSRYLKEKELGHKLSRKYDIHHKDGDTLNDDITNLKIKLHSGHIRKHMTGKKHLLGHKHSKETRLKMKISRYKYLFGDD